MQTNNPFSVQSAIGIGKDPLKKNVDQEFDRNRAFLHCDFAVILVKTSKKNAFHLNQRISVL